MRDLVAPVLLLLGVGLDALPSLRLVLPELPLVVPPVDGPDDVVEVPGPAQHGDEARERLERGRRRDLRELAQDPLQNAARGLAGASASPRRSSAARGAPGR